MCYSGIYTIMAFDSNLNERAQAIALSRYVQYQRNEVEGWLSRIDAEIILAVQHAQNESNLIGSAVEIGLHHGKSFIALCMGLRDGEVAYGIDLFENQDLNLDHSGRGNALLLEKNLLRFGISRDRIFLDARASEQVTPTDILSTAGPARIFSIDGGHWQDVVINDLRLAESVMADCGVIALDDFHRSEWPEVSAGYFSWRQDRNRDIVPFAIGFNKLYLCLRDKGPFYQAALLSSEFLQKFLVKKSNLQGDEVLVYQSFMLPEFTLIRRLQEHLRLYYPELYFRARTWRSRFRK
jgi:hypothetical protein